jgi:putative spermidine/putrescine transport system substrate-binding protein
MLGGGSMSDIPQNMQPAWDYYEKLKKQQPLLGEDPDFTSWFQQGEIDLACTIITNARAAKQKGIAVDWTVPKEGAKVDTDSLWVPQQLPENETYWAKQYVNFALSADAQQKWCNGLGLPPVRPGLTPPEDMQGDPAYPTEKADYKRLIRVPNDVLVRHQKDWFARFNEIMQA